MYEAVAGTTSSQAGVQLLLVGESHASIQRVTLDLETLPGTLCLHEFDTTDINYGLDTILLANPHNTGYNLAQL